MKVVIFGAGQAGRMIRSWIPASDEFLCFADNNEKLWGSVCLDRRILSPEEALGHNPDLIWLAVINREAQEAVYGQLRDMGFAGIVKSIHEVKDTIDLRAAALRLAAAEIAAGKVEGCAAELGVYRGAFAAEINRLLPDRTLYLFDTFTGFAPEDLEIERESGIPGKTGDFTDTSVSLVRDVLPHPEKAVFIPGRFPESLSAYLEKKGESSLPKLAFVSLDPDLYEPVYQGLRVFYPLLNEGGMIMIHDYNSCQFPGVHRAVERFCREEHLFVLPLMDIHGSAVLLKQGK